MKAVVGILTEWGKLGIPDVWNAALLFSYYKKNIMRQAYRTQSESRCESDSALLGGDPGAP